LTEKESITEPSSGSKKGASQDYFNRDTPEKAEATELLGKSGREENFGGGERIETMPPKIETIMESNVRKKRKSAVPEVLRKWGADEKL